MKICPSNSDINYLIKITKIILNKNNCIVFLLKIFSISQDLTSLLLHEFYK